MAGFVIGDSPVYFQHGHFPLQGLCKTFGMRLATARHPQPGCRYSTRLHKYLNSWFNTGRPSSKFLRFKFRPLVNRDLDDWTCRPRLSVVISASSTRLVTNFVFFVQLPTNISVCILIDIFFYLFVCLLL